jgi:histidine ammonia-lyase
MTNTPSLRLSPGSVSLRELRSFHLEGASAALSEDVFERVLAAHRQVEAITAGQDAVYGINTGFGLLARERIPNERLRELQRNLILSHSTGTGDELDAETTRLVVLLKLIGLGRGHSGVRPVVLERLQELLDRGLLPCIPAKGSVGASGDLAPLAHLTATLLGEGELRRDDKRRPAAEFLKAEGIPLLVLGPKEGLALINGTQVSTALALSALLKAERVFAAAVVCGALSIEAAKGSSRPFDPRIHLARGQEGQIDVARAYARLLGDSEIRRSHAHCGRVQDPYSLRCQPQVMGASLDSLRHGAKILRIEANAATDNPLLFPEDDAVLSGGNFHAEPVAQVADLLAVAIAEIGAISERRIALLVDPNTSGLPAFLVKDGGVNSGFMIAHVTAAALASENKSLAHPSSVDSIPTSANQEDHVSMATYGARRLHEMIENVATIVGIELLAAAQGIGFHRPLRSSERLERFVALLREHVAPYEQDRFFAPDIEAAKSLVLSGAFVSETEELLPSYQA